MSGLAIELESTDSAPHEARETIRAGLGERLPAVTLYDLLTVVSELVANGVIYGDGEKVYVRVDVEPDGRVTGEVSNDGQGEVRMRQADVVRDTGLGLRIVAALVERWRVKVTDATRVWFELRSP
ncbi:MAG TPA: ATP-binding protein [Solirubrobacterales bacterium]|nr:ATP-binding protein [Solirubrobacterales bacterium]